MLLRLRPGLAGCVFGALPFSLWHSILHSPSLPP